MNDPELNPGLRKTNMIKDIIGTAEKTVIWIID